MFSQGPLGRSGAPGIRGSDVSKYYPYASGYNTFSMINYTFHVRRKVKLVIRLHRAFSSSREQLCVS